jgi:3-oxoacyl-[acyl-carrier protein] reductase
MKLKDRVALVTGGGSGLGRAIALLFAEEGAHVVVNELRLDAAERIVAEMKGPGGGRAIQADVADSAQVKAMFATIERGALDILVNNAGIAFGPGDDRKAIGQKSEAVIMEMVSGRGVQTHLDITQNLSDESWRRMLAVHLDGTFFCTREALRLMSPQNRGAIINLSSVAALTGLEAAPHYIDTPMTEPMSPLIRAAVIARTPLRRTGDPREVAATALFLACDDSSFFTGQWLSPNGGLFVG